MINKERVSEVLEKTIRPALQSHGGDAVLVDVTDDGIVKIILEGACHGCPMARMTVTKGIQERLRQAVPEVKEVVTVEPELEGHEEEEEESAIE